MCTSIAMTTNDFYFGRNMDLDYHFGERIVLTPRNYPIEFRKAGSMENHYAILGMAAVAENYPLYAEAMNEKGLCIAGLQFPDNAFYPDAEESCKYNVSPFELTLWILGKCASADEAEKLLSETNIVNIPFSKEMPLTSLHWHIADSKRSLTLEVTKKGTNLCDNPVGVLTNNPPFEFHMTNLCNYMNLTPEYPQNRLSSKIELIPYGNGFGAIGLPGDYSPSARFVKTVFMKFNSECECNNDSSVSQFFHIMEAVSVVRGCVINNENKLSVTTYSCCMNATKGYYYYKTYSNSRLTAVDMFRENLDDHCLKEFPLMEEQSVLWLS
ncbi:MAG: choloylglycine hydrolase [Oscillospiraceae bacterium]|nr:choloylglycine hydrolase [Oscillospiraceae bacterium]